MFSSLQVIQIVLLSAAVVGHSPLPEIDFTNRARPKFSFGVTCEEFEQNAHLDPEDVVDSLWKIFYYWAKGMEVSTILLSLPSEEKVNDFRNVVETYSPSLRVEWKNAALFLEPRPGVKVLLVSRERAGSYLAVVYIEHHPDEQHGPHVHTTDIRVKAVGRYLGIMNCDDGTAFAMARVDEMPATIEHCKTAAASLGFKAETGKSYLSIRELPPLDEL